MRHRTVVAALSLSSLLAVGAVPAAAQPAGEFMTLDRADHESRVGAFLGLLHVEDTDVDEGALRLELHGQVLGEGGVGGYAAVPIHQLFLDGADDETALGNIEVGVLAARRRLGQELAVHAGLTLPTASDSLAGLVTNVLGAQTRLTDVIQSVPELWALRLGASYLGGMPGVSFRVDAGADVPIASNVDDTDVEHDPILRLNGALGVGVLGAGTLAFEVVNLIATGDEESSLSESTLTNAGVSLGVSLAGVHAQGGLFLSVDSVFEDDFEQGLISFALAAAKSF